MDFRTTIKAENFGFSIGHLDTGLMIGSCFTDNMGEKMAAGKMPVSVNPFGVIYNPLSVVKTLRLMEKGGRFPADGVRESGGVWFDFALHGSFSATTKEALLEKADRALEAAHEILKEASYIIITLGTSWIYEYTGTGEVVCNCHKVPASKFRRYKLETEEIVKAFDELLSEELYKNKQVIFTVSPVRHLKDGFAGNQLSKSTLITAVHKLAGKYDNVHYYPAYEIMMDDLRDYRFYKSDMIHPSDEAVEYIWGHFCETLIRPESRELMKRISKIAAAMAHRPFNPDTEGHRAFRQSILKEINAITKEYPGIELPEETAYFSEQ